jgi:hypothetical protein
MSFNPRLDGVETRFNSSRTIDKEDFDWMIKLINAQDKVITTGNTAIETSKRYVEQMEEETKDLKIKLFQKDIEIHEIKQQLAETDKN